MLVEISDVIIDTLKRAYKKYGYDLLETKEGWSDIVEDLLNEKITDDFGDV